MSCSDCLSKRARSMSSISDIVPLPCNLASNSSGSRLFLGIGLAQGFVELNFKFTLGLNRWGIGHLLGLIQFHHRVDRRLHYFLVDGPSPGCVAQVERHIAVIHGVANDSARGVGDHRKAAWGEDRV